MGLYAEKWAGKLVKVEGKTDAKQFCEILEDSLMESFETLGIEDGEHYVQQDNNLKHTSKKPRSGLKTMVFKSYSYQPNFLTSIQLNFFEDILNANFINTKLHWRECMNYGTRPVRNEMEFHQKLARTSHKEQKAVILITR